MKTILIALCSIIIWTAFTGINQTEKLNDLFHSLESNNVKTRFLDPLTSIAKRDYLTSETTTNRFPYLKNKDGKHVWGLTHSTKKKKAEWILTTEKVTKITFPIVETSKAKRGYFDSKIKASKRFSLVKSKNRIYVWGLTHTTIKNWSEIILNKVKELGLWLIKEQFHLIILLILYLVNQCYNSYKKDDSFYKNKSLPFFLLRNS